MSTIHPDVQNTLDYSDAVQESLLSYVDKMKGHRSERVSEDRDIAVKVDMSGQLDYLWLKPGLLDRKSPALIAKELTALVTGAAADSKEVIASLYQQAHQLPDMEEVVQEAKIRRDAQRGLNQNRQ